MLYLNNIYPQFVKQHQQPEMWFKESKDKKTSLTREQDEQNMKICKIYVILMLYAKCIEIYTYFFLCTLIL